MNTDRRTEAIRLESAAPGHTRLVLANPARRNALGIPELSALAEAVNALRAAPPKVLSIVAEGGSFGVGGDLQAFGQAVDQGRITTWLGEAVSHFNVAIEGLRALDSAIVVGVQGAAAGGTLGLVWAADHVIVAEDLKINLAYARIGGSPDGGTSWFLPRLVNPLRAFELFTLCPTLDAQRALQWGLANQVVPAAGLGAAVDGVAARWLDVPDVSLRNFKRLLRDSQAQALAPHLAQELRGFVEAGAQPAFATKVRAFLDKT